jgi:hypothetical protein
MENTEKKTTKNYVPMPMGLFNHEDKSKYITHSNDYAFNLCFEIAKMAQHLWTFGTAVTNVAFLSELPTLTMGIADKSNRRTKIKQVLSFMVKGKYMKITPSKFSNDTIISIEVMKPWEAKDDGSKAYNRYVEVNQEFYDSCLGNPRFFRALIYAEHRMFRGQENEGTWIMHNDEWSNALDLKSRSDINDLTAEMHALNIMDKIQGQKYTDENGQIRDEGSRYHPVSGRVREKRLEKVAAQEKGETLEHSHKRNMAQAEAMLEVTDERVFNTNLFDLNVKLNDYDMYIFVDTTCEVTKAFVENRRLIPLEKSKAGLRQAFIDKGFREKKKREGAAAARAATEAMSQCYSEPPTEGYDHAAAFARKQANMKKQEEDKRAVMIEESRIALSS